MSEVSQLHDRIAGRRAGPPEDDAAAFDDCGAFGFLRGTRDRALMIDFRFQNGTCEGFATATLDRVIYTPSEGLVLRFLGVQVVLHGRNFAAPQPSGVSLLQALHRHRVPWVREVEELRGQFYPPDAVVVTRIEVIEGP